MKKIILISLFFLISFIVAQQAKAEGRCHINNCFVPAPTIVVPINNTELTETKPGIRGLTWKRTLVDIYLDGQYQGPVLLREHENHLQSFFWQPPEDLKPGQHFVFTIAHNARGYDKTLKGWDQSKESAYIYFNIEDKKITSGTKQKNIQPAVGEELTLVNESVTEDKFFSAQEKNFDKIVNLDNQSLNNQPKISGKTVFYKPINKQLILRIIGLSFLIVIVLIVVVSYAIKRKKEILKKLMSEKIKEEAIEDYPPPPPPLNQSSLGI